MAMTESLKAAQARYNKRMGQWHMRLDKQTDADIIEWLNNQASATAAVKALIRANINRKNKSCK